MNLDGYISKAFRTKSNFCWNCLTIIKLPTSRKSHVVISTVILGFIRFTTNSNRVTNNTTLIIYKAQLGLMVVSTKRYLNINILLTILNNYGWNTINRTAILIDMHRVTRNGIWSNSNPVLIVC